MCNTWCALRLYTDTESTETIDLQLVRAKATKEPFLGSVLINPRGPGDAGRNSLDSTYETLSGVLGGQYDIVAWDYRGTATTLSFSCFETETERSTDYAGLIELATDSSDTAIGQAWSAAEWMTAYCTKSSQAQDVGEIIGTAFTARDMMQIVDALGEDDLLRFWGMSYGSVLGETVAAMFPDRIDRVLLDAVLNPTEYWAGGSVSQLTDADKTFASFCAECLKAPDLCPLAARATTVTELESLLCTFPEEVKYEPVVMGVNGPLSYVSIKITILGGLYDPGMFPTTALYLESLPSRNETFFEAYIATITAGTASPNAFPEYTTAATKEDLWGIRCGDEILRAPSKEDATPLIEKFHAESNIVGDIT